MDYLLVDPFASASSGVTTYCRHALARLQGLGLKAEVIAPAQGESLEHFRRRLPVVLAERAHARTVVEAPESLAVTRYVTQPLRLHVRLHGSRLFGAWLQGLPQDRLECLAEQREVERARWVSAPSHAAIETHRLHFGGHFQASPYPNPMAEPTAPTGAGSPNIDYLFLGRWQALKGTHFFLSMARALPERRFAVACESRPKGLPDHMAHLPARTDAEKRAALARSVVVIVPSLFETASMVALEALVSGCRVVAWHHLGVAEYATTPALHLAQAWQVEDLAREGEKALALGRNSEGRELVRRLNSGFDNAIQALLVDRDAGESVLRPVTPAIDYGRLFETMPTMDLSARPLVLKRKFRKLLRDPAAFWKDSGLARLFGGQPSPVPQALPPPPSPAPEAPSVASSAPKRPSPLMGVFPAEGFVKLRAPAKAPTGWSIAIVHFTKDSDEVDEIIAALQTYTDFKPTQAAHLNLIECQCRRDETLPSMISRIDTKNKEFIGQVNQVLMINAPDPLVQAFRSAAPLTRVISVATSTAPADVAVEPDIADAVVCLDSHPAALLAGWRRRLTVSAPSQLPTALLRLIRETGPKDPDMLFQIMGDPLYDPELSAFDPVRYQGRIRLSGGRLPTANSMQEFLQALAPNIGALYVLESVYMRYRSLCSAVEQGESAAPLLEACLKDGVLFDVA